MTREEEIEKEAYRVSDNGDEFSSFILGAEWADETMIDKACEWLCMNMTSIEYFGINGNIIKPNFIRRFKKAMKGE
jgi:hypothetical protein